MTLQDLYEQIAPTLPASMQKDLKTAVRVLSHALQYMDPYTCPLEACLQPLPTLAQLVDAYLNSQGKGPYTIRNTKNLLSRLFREATSKKLLAPPQIILTPRFSQKQRPPRPGSERFQRDGTYLLFQDWPPRLKQDFADFGAWATRHMVNGREASLRKRPITIGNYRQSCEMYFGFLLHVRHERCLSFEQLFDLPRLKAFLDWHINVKHQRVTRIASEFLAHLLTLTHQYRPLPDLRAELQALNRTLPSPPPTYQKSDAWVPLAQQEQVGLAIWPQIPPHGLLYSGRGFAVYAGISLLLRLWVRIPYRLRNMREMRLYDNLYRDPHGVWRIRFVGEELKIAARDGRPNVFDLPFPQDLTPTLEDYLESWRPRLVSLGHTPREIFLTKFGNPYTTAGLRSVTKSIMYRYTGRHWHPHIVRTVWATEYIRATSDYYGAAVMLNDRLETVIQTYAHLREENVADKAYQWVHSHIALRATP